MIVVGCDPGLRNCGFAVFEYVPGGPHDTVLMTTTAKTDTTIPMVNRMQKIWRVAHYLMREHEPALVVIEDQAGAFAGKQKEKKTNAKALWLRDVCGIVMAEAFAVGAAVGNVTPQQAKIAVLGQGSRSADKKQIMRMVEAITTRRLNEHEADAFAIGLAGARRFAAAVTRSKQQSLPQPKEKTQ